MRKLFIAVFTTVLIHLMGVAQTSEMKIATDIIGLTNEYNLAWETLDMDSVASFHSEDFVYYWHGGLSVSSNDDFVDGYKKIMSSAAEWSMYIDNLQVQVLDTNNVIIGFDVTETRLVLKDGTEHNYGIGAMSYFWHRRDGEWKLVHIHESELRKDDDVEESALALAYEWVEAWNGEIDLDHMMSLHHADLQYYWRGEPVNYDGLRHTFTEYIIGKENYNLKLINPVVTVIDADNAAVGFQIIEKGQSPEEAEGAFSLMITRTENGWKVIHIHES